MNILNNAPNGGRSASIIPFEKGHTMSCSPGRLLANRRNALQSTGPKTVEGKERSRQNSFKHGLTGNGVVVPAEQVPEVARRFETLQRELKPSGEAGRIFLRRFAYLSVRLEKCEEFDTYSTASRVRHAVEVFDDHRLTEVEGLIMHFESDPMTVTRRLQNSPEGVDWLVKHWGELRLDLMNVDRQVWTLNHRSRMEQLLGMPGGNIRMTRIYALSQALSGHFDFLEAVDGAGLAENERIAWARAELAKILDAEVSRLQGVRTALNPESIDRDRREAPSRALFDASPELNLARKYEAATERAMYKALDQFHEVELVALEMENSDTTGSGEETSDNEMGSFLPRSEREPEPVDLIMPSIDRAESGKSGEFASRLKPARVAAVG